MPTIINGTTGVNLVQDGVVGLSTLASNSVNQAKVGTNTLAGTGPAFSAYNTVTTSVSSATWTKVTYDTENFDTNSNFASSRFTPTVAGYYLITATYRYNGTFSAGNTPANIYKNGSAACLGAGTAASSFGYTTVNTVMYFNGSTDYAEIYAYQDSGTTRTIASDPNTIFSGVLIRAA